MGACCFVDGDWFFFACVCCLCVLGRMLGGKLAFFLDARFDFGQECQNPDCRMTLWVRNRLLSNARKQRLPGQYPRVKRFKMAYVFSVGVHLSREK